MDFITEIVVAGCIWVSLESVVATLIIRFATGKWWWHKVKGDWNIHLGANSWGFEGKGSNPFETLKKLWSDVSGENVSTEERINATVKRRVNNRMDKYADKMIDVVLDNKKLKQRMQKYVFDKVMDELNAGELNEPGHRMGRRERKG